MAYILIGRYTDPNDIGVYDVITKTLKVGGTIHFMKDHSFTKQVKTIVPTENYKFDIYIDGNNKLGYKFGTSMNNTFRSIIRK